MYQEKTIKTYLADLASDKHIPGGGSCIPLLGALTNAIVRFVVNLSINKKKYQTAKAELEALRLRAESLQNNFLPLIDRDCEILDEILSAWKNADCTETERNETVKRAIDFSLTICNMCFETLEIGLEIAKLENRMLSSDVEIIALLGEAALNGSISNIKINITTLNDAEYREETAKKCRFFIDEGKKIKNKIIDLTNLQI
ncbi:MAG: cyclodeaminase/cyclohydrolase family protein [Prevotellaceae bacterium]|jgi:formiminotetrahydrofolate cyclodeaminase|nr:cyclodeaminase/cyclohydrolase family protein [Prevotellaceae bacterium]